MKTILIAVSLFGAAACSAHNRPALNAASLSSPPAPALDKRSDKSPSSGVVHIADDIRQACGIAESEAYFAFDSAQLGGSDKPVLEKLVTCFKSGPFAGREMRLVGHADPRGSDDYNMVLGGNRADTVKTFLVVNGLPGTRIATTSRGDMDARGTDERGWAEDRRVDVLAH